MEIALDINEIPILFKYLRFPQTAMKLTDSMNFQLIDNRHLNTQTHSTDRENEIKKEREPKAAYFS